MHLKQHPISNSVLIALIASIFFSASCIRPNPGPENVIDAHTDGIYVLNEGLFQMNNCTLSYYDIAKGTVTDNIFLQANGRGLGDSGNDLQRYGNRLYAVINNSNRVEVMDLKTAQSIKAIDLPGKQPRHICFHDGKAYVSCFDGDVVRIDTATLNIETSVHSGNNPEGICVSSGKLYVANSGGLNYPNYDNTISIFDLNTMSLLKTITVGSNPSKLCTDNDGFVYVCCRGNYDNESGRLFKIDPATDQPCQEWEHIQNFSVFQGKAYVYDVSYKASANIQVIDLHQSDNARKAFITDGTSIQMPYSITVNPLNGDVYIADAYDFTVTGDIYCFSSEGKLKFSFGAGLNPNSIVFNN